MKGMNFSGNENIDYSQYTKKTFGSRKLFLLIASILAAVSDFVLMIVLAITGSVGVAVPVILLVLDGLFIAGVCLSNFRFKYALGVWISYLILSVTVVSTLATLDSGATFVTDTAKCLNIFSHIALYLTIALASVYPLLKSNVKLKAAMITFVSIAVILVGAFSVYASVNGYFGQGFLGEYRTVGYTLDEASDTYIAMSVKNGRSDKVIIPEEFNGKKVSSVNCSLFIDSSIKNIELKSREKLDFIETNSLNYFNEDIKIGVDKNYIDDYRREFLSMASYSLYDTSVLRFINSMYPVNLQSDERYVTFEYEQYPAMMEIIPTWIGKSGENFSIDFASVDYLQHSDADNTVDLVWCRNNNNSKILTGEIMELNGNKIISSVNNVKIEFEKVFAITVGEDNDELYEPSDDFKTTAVGNEVYDYRLVTLGNADALFDEVSREGFDVTWEYKLYPYSSYNAIPSLKDALAIQSSDSAYIRPRWTMKRPTDINITFDKDDYIYGDDVSAFATATSPSSEFRMQFDWIYVCDGASTDIVNDTDRYSISNALPQSGSLGVNVTVTSTGSSLSASDQVITTLNVVKRPLNIYWQEPADMVYDGQTKPVSHYIDEGELINGDVFNSAVSNVSNINAGSYNAMAWLIGDFGQKYTVASGMTHYYTIAPRPVQVSWSSGDYTYDGELHNASATAVGIDGFIPLSVSASKTNAGIHTATVSTSNYNYTLTNPTYEFEIKQKSVTVNWGNTALTYSGEAQYPKVSSVVGRVGNDDVASQLIYSGYSSNIAAGNGYTVKVELPASSNYKFDSEQTTSYNINKKALRVRASATDKTYDGKIGTFDFTVEGLVSIHDKSSLGTPSYVGDGATATDVGNYSVSVSLPANSVTDNYNITYTAVNFAIFRARFTLEWSQYATDGSSVIPPTVTSTLPQGTEISGYVYRDVFDRTMTSVPYENGTYSVEVKITNGNYVFVNTTVKFTVDTVSNRQGEAA